MKRPKHHVGFYDNEGSSGSGAESVDTIVFVGDIGYRKNTGSPSISSLSTPRDSPTPRASSPLSTSNTPTESLSEINESSAERNSSVSKGSLSSSNPSISDNDTTRRESPIPKIRTRLSLDESHFDYVKNEDTKLDAEEEPLDSFTILNEMANGRRSILTGSIPPEPLKEYNPYKIDHDDEHEEVKLRAKVYPQEDEDEVPLFQRRSRSPELDSSDESDMNHGNPRGVLVARTDSMNVMDFVEEILKAPSSGSSSCSSSSLSYQNNIDDAHSDHENIDDMFNIDITPPVEENPKPPLPPLEDEPIEYSHYELPPIDSNKEESQPKLESDGKKISFEQENENILEDVDHEQSNIEPSQVSNSIYDDSAVEHEYANFKRKNGSKGSKSSASRANRESFVVPIEVDRVEQLNIGREVEEEDKKESESETEETIEDYSTTPVVFRPNYAAAALKMSDDEVSQSARGTGRAGGSAIYDDPPIDNTNKKGSTTLPTPSHPAASRDVAVTPSRGGGGGGSGGGGGGGSGGGNQTAFDFNCNQTMAIVAEQIDMGNRDKNGLNAALKTGFFDVFGEPDPDYHSVACVWTNSFRVFEIVRIYVYKILTLIFALPIAVIMGFMFALFTFFQIWFIIPMIAIMRMVLARIVVIWPLTLLYIVRPFFYSVGAIFSTFRLQRNEGPFPQEVWEVV